MDAKLNARNKYPRYSKKQVLQQNIGPRRHKLGAPPASTPGEYSLQHINPFEAITVLGDREWFVVVHRHAAQTSRQDR